MQNIRSYEVPCYDGTRAIKPSVLIGTFGVGQTFTKEVVEAMAAFNERPLIMALSNPTSQAKCTSEQAYTWTEVTEISYFQLP
ncbi:putative malate dehydrogenase (oxaloacetate-decarboxylating) (NADP(+)) [Helianthus debilis subsp. tardiflorus]